MKLVKGYLSYIRKNLKKCLDMPQKLVMFVQTIENWWRTKIFKNVTILQKKLINIILLMIFSWFWRKNQQNANNHHNKFFMLFLLVILLYVFVWLGLCLAYHVEVHNIHCVHAMKRKKNYKTQTKPIVFILIHLFKYEHMPFPFVYNGICSCLMWAWKCEPMIV